MGLYDDQIRERIRMDDEEFQNSMFSMAGIVMGEKISRALENDRIKTKNAIEEILKFFHARPVPMPDDITDINEQLEYQLRPAGIMYRTVNLEDGWYKDSIGPMLGVTREDGTPIALVPEKLFGYSYYDYEQGKRVKVGSKTSEYLSDEAIVFYKSLPLKKIGIKDLTSYAVQSFTYTDIAMVAITALIVSLIGMLLPWANNLIYGKVLSGGSYNLLIGVFAFLFSVTVSQLIFRAVNTLLIERISSKVRVQVQAAGMMRLLSLPAVFFKDKPSGDLAARMSYIEEVTNTMTRVVLTTSFTTLFSLVYISQMLHYGPGVVVPGLLVILFTLLFSVVFTIAQVRISRQIMELHAKEAGTDYAIISGVQKIKLAGAEKRAFSKWAEEYTELAKLQYDPPAVIKFSTVVTSCISLIGTIVIYYFTIKTNVALEDYFAFNVAYGNVMGAFVMLVAMIGDISMIQPMLEMVKPILETVPEVAENKSIVTRLSGGIEMNGVSFRYNDNMPFIFDNLSLRIAPGQYVAIVGKTGCGKSTLMRLLLGFELPQKGAIYYDGRDLNTLDLKSLRRHIGTVMQNGKLFQGDIYSNITISAPQMSVDDAWEVAETAGIADDIRDMPMGMHTVISESGGGISGGQKQRLMIARAIAPKPKILMFDEATSALDNVTQKKISDALDALNCTRIVIAHRLSTIKHCDRILVIDDGKISEDGTYDELLAKKGLFAELVERQRLDTTENKE